MMILFKDISLLEHDAQTQYKFNRFWALVWSLTMVAIPCVPTLYAHSVSALIIQEISLWANFATHFGAMSAALAAKNTARTLGDTTYAVSDMDTTVDDIQDNVNQIADALSGE